MVQLRSAEDRDAALHGHPGEDSGYHDRRSVTTVGDSYTLNASVKDTRIKEIAQSTIRQNLATLRNRINALGVAEPLIQQQGDTRIVVELPACRTPGEAKKILGATATLEYHAVDETVATRSKPSAPATCRRTAASITAASADRTASLFRIVLKKKIIVSGDELVDASSAPDPQSRFAGGVGRAQCGRRPQDARLHHAERRQADGGGLHRAHAGNQDRRRQGSAQREGHRGSDQLRDDPGRVLATASRPPAWAASRKRRTWRCCCARVRWRRRSTSSRSA